MGQVAFEALEGPPRLHVADTVGNEQYTLYTDEPVSPEPVSTDGFEYPVSDAVRVETAGFELADTLEMHLWNRDGELLHVFGRNNGFQAPSGEYTLELCMPVKTYIRFTGAVSAARSADRSSIRFGEATSIVIGARSPRKQPAHTITTTRNPTDVMRALSHLGEGLMTTTPSRAYPSLRGYPSEIELGDELAVPDGIDTGPQPVTLALPAEFEYLYEAAPLIYYLNADVQPASRPHVRVGGEQIHAFDTERFADEVEALLRHVFVLDCVVRSVGSYPIGSVECDRLLGAVPFDIEDLYRADQGSRLRMYLDIPFDRVRMEAPEWPAIAHVEPTSEHVETIPHLVAQLVPIRAASPDRISGTEAQRAALTAFIRNEGPTRAASKVFDGDASFVDVESPMETTDIWVGSDVPISANKLVVDGFRNRFRRPTGGERSIDVTIVCNEDWMGKEASIVRERYLEREDLPFEVTFHEHLDCESLAELLMSDADFFHYIGHATSEGFECRDGYLDVSSIPSVGVETFFLNACQSYRQATKLVEGGSIGGIATLSDVTDQEANKVGRTVAKLLNLGFPLRVANEVASTRSIVGGQYLAVGDDGTTIAPAESVPYWCFIDSNGTDYELKISTFQGRPVGPGSLYLPRLTDSPDRYLTGKTIGRFDLSSTELRAFLQQENMPVQFDGEFRWAFDLAEELD